MFGDGPVPVEQDMSVKDDDSGFRDVARLLLRSWPYIRPQLLGRWWIPGDSLQDQVADNIAGSGYQFKYAPFLVFAIALAGPWLNFVPQSMQWPYNLLYVPAITMAFSMSVMAFAAGRFKFWGTIGLLLSGIGVNVVANFVIDGWRDGIYAAAVTVACVFGWMVQYRAGNGALEFRVRLHAHLVYFYAINFMQRGIGFALGLITIDMLNQSLLQGEPLSPWVSSLIGVPEWAQGNLNELSIEQRHELKWTYFYIIIGAFLIQWPLQIINPYYNMWIMQRINQDLRVALLQRWHQLSLSYHSDHRTGDSIYRIYQDSSMVTSVVGQLISLTQVMMSYYTCVALVSLLSPWIALMAGTLVVPALLWAHWAMPRVRTFSLVYRAATSDVTSTIQETFGSIKLIKAFNTTRRAQQRLENDSVIAFNAAYRVRKLIAFVTIVMFTIAASFMISGEFLMAWWASNSESTYATDLIAVVGLSWLVWNLASFTWTRNNFRESANDLRSLLRNWMTAQDMAMGLRRVFDILDIDPEITNRDDAIPMTGFRREIRFENVSFSYEAKRPVLEDVTFSATPGSISALIGPTGSGKSTLMALLLRLFDPAAGSISIDGIDLRNYQIESLRRHIAIALQENVLFGMSVRENIRYVAPEASDAEVSEAVRIADMSEYVSGLPHGLDTVLSDRGGKLSTGQRQRLSIARAVVRDTPILVLDEPTAALDAATEHRVMENLSEWGSSQGRAIFVITHRISTIRRAENILYLDSGRILESGSHEALMQIENGRYRGFVETESSLRNIQRPS